MKLPSDRDEGMKDIAEKLGTSAPTVNIESIRIVRLVAGLQNHRHNHIEVGSEILVPAAPCLTDDNVRQKLDAGAILVHGKEELPLGYEEADNNRKRRPYSTGQINHERINNLENDEEHRRLSDDELVRVRRTEGGRRRLRSAGSDQEEYYTGRNKNKNDDQLRDKNANARITRGNLTTHRQSATLPRRRRRRALSGSFAGNPLPPHRVTPDGTAIYYWCELPRRPGSQGKFFFPLPKKKNTSTPHIYAYIYKYVANRSRAHALMHALIRERPFLFCGLSLSF